MVILTFFPSLLGLVIPPKKPSRHEARHNRGMKSVTESEKIIFSYFFQMDEYKRLP